MAAKQKSMNFGFCVVFLFSFLNFEFIFLIYRSNCIEDSKTLLIASKALQPVNQQRSLKLIQRAILLYPQNMNAWNALLQVH